MKIEVGKYYKNRRGEIVGPVQSNDDYEYPFQTVMFGVYRSYTSEGRYYFVDEDPNDLVEECNADGSPIVVQSNPLTADRSWRDEIALRVLPMIYAEFQRDAQERGCPNGWRTGICMDAFILADEFIKVAKQS